MRGLIALLVVGTLALIGGSLAYSAFWGERVEVPPAHKGKVLTRNGFKPETVPPSKFRLDACWTYCDRLVIAEMSDTGMKETFRLFMPKDQLNMAFDIRFTMSLRDEETTVDTIFARIPDDGGKIPALKVYKTYGQPVLREVIRTTVAKYSINEVASSREKLNAEIYAAVRKHLKGTPISVTRLAFADIQFPKVIVEAKIAAAKRRAEIQQAEADKQVILVQTQTQLEQAKANRAVRREKALAAKEENEIAAASVTPAYLQYKQLEVLSRLAENPNAVFVPFDALGTVGLSQRVFQKAN